MEINVYHGRRSFEISLEIKSLETPTESYPISALVRLFDAKRGEEYKVYSTHTVEGVAEGVRRLAKLLHECLKAGVLDDKQLFSRLKLQRHDLAGKYALEVQLSQGRQQSESAWAKKDFAKVVKILSPLQEHLNPSDLKKLEYAKKHL